MTKQNINIVGEQKVDPNIKMIGDEGVVPSEASPKELEDIELAFGEPIDRNEANQRILGGSQELQRSTINDGFMSARIQDDVVTDMRNQQAKETDFTDNSSFSYEQAVSVVNPDMSPTDQRFVVNFKTARDMTQEAIDAEVDDAFWAFGDAAVDFTDSILRDMTLGIPEAFGDRVERDSFAIMYNASALSPEEFKVWFKENIVDDYKAQGIITDNNSWALYKLLEVVHSKGIDSSKDARKFWALIDAADVTGIAAGAAKGAKVLLTSTKVGRKTANESVESVSDFVDTQAKAKKVDPQVQADTGPKSLNPHKQPVEIPSQNFSRIKHENRIVQTSEEILDQVQQLLGESERSAAIGRYRTRVQEDLKSKNYSVEADLNYRDYDSPRFVGKVTTANGKPFKAFDNGTPSALANTVAKKLGGEVKPIDPTDLKKGYYVETTSNVKFTDEIDAIEDLELNYNSFKEESTAVSKELAGQDKNKLASSLSSITGFILTPVVSAKGRSTARATALIDLGDRNLSAIKKNVLDPSVESLRKLPIKDREFIDNLATSIRDGDLVDRKNWLSEDEFVARYQQAKGKKPSQAVIDGYNAMVDLNDFVAYQKAKSLLQRYVELDYKSVRVGNWTSAGRKFVKGAVDADATVFDARNGTFIKRSDIEENVPLFATLDPYKANNESATYILAGDITELEMKDVMGYNAGGSRMNPDAKYFLGGLDEYGNTRIILSTTTEKESKVALEELQTLQKALADGTISDELVAANGQFNGGKFQTVEELRDWLDKDWPDFERVQFKSKERDADFVWEGEGAHGALFDGISQAEYAQISMSRSDRLLEHFGGNTTRQLSSLEVLEKEIGNSAQELAFRSHNLVAATALVKRAEQAFPAAFKNVSAPEGDTITRMFQMEIPGNTMLAKQLREQRNIILRRMGARSEFGKTIDAYANTVREFIIDNTSKSVRDTLDKIPFVKEVKDVDLNAFTGRALGANHFLAFFASPVQLMLQASHMMNIFSISPKSAFKGSGMAFSMRQSVLNTKVSHSERMVAAARLADYMGYTKEQMDEIVELSWKWGADIIDGENLENGMGHTYGFGPKKSTLVSEFGDRVGKSASWFADKGMIPYNLGERMSQMTSFYTAVDEFIKNNPNKALNSPEAFKLISDRANNLNFNMRRTSRSAIQQGLAQIPLQFLTYQFRAMEAVLIGRGFSATERARLAAALTVPYGAYGLASEDSARELLEENGVDPNSEFGTFLRFGLIDGLFGSAGLPTGLAPRLTVVGGFFDLVTRVREDSFLEVIGGPTAGLLANAAQSGFGLVQALVTGDTYEMNDAFIRTVRSASAGNNLLAARSIFKYGVLTGRKGNSSMSDLEFNVVEGVLKSFGVTTLKESTFWELKQDVWKSDRDAQATIKKYAPRFERSAIKLRDAVAKGDSEAIQEAEAEIRELIVVLDVVLLGEGYTRSQINSIRRSILNPDKQGMQALIEAQTRQGKSISTAQSLSN